MSHLKIIVFLLGGVIIISPFFSGGENIYIKSFLLISLGLIVLLCNKTKIVFLDYIWIAFFIFLLINIFISSSFYDSFDNLFYVMLCYLIFFLARQISWKEEYFYLLSLILLVNASILSLIGIYYYLIGDYNRVTSTFFWPNAFAGYLLLILTLGLGMLWNENSSKRRLLLLGINTLIFSSFVLTQSRASYLSLAFALVILVILLKPKKKIITQTFALIICIFLLSNFLFSLKQQKPSLIFFEKESVNNEDIDTGISFRKEYWQGAFQIFINNPFLGSGSKTFYLEYPAFQKTPISYAKYAHNTFFEMIAEGGLIIGLLFIALIVKLLLDIWRNKKSYYQICFFTGMIASLIHINFDFDWHFLANQLTFWMIAGLLYNSIPKKENKLFKSFVVTCCLLIILRGGGLLISQTYFQNYQNALLNHDNVKALESIQKSFDYSLDPDLLLRETFLSTEKLKIMSLALRLNGKKSSYYQSVYKIHSENYEIEKAEKAILKAIQLDPLNHPSYKMDLVWLYIQQNKLEEALSLIDQTLNYYTPEIIQFLKNRQKEIASQLKINENEVNIEHLQIIPKLYEFKKILEEELKYDRFQV